MKILKAVGVVVAVAAVILVARELPPPPGVGQSTAIAGTIDVDAVLTEVPVDEVDTTLAVEEPVDPFAPITIDPAIPAVTAAVGQFFVFNVSDEEQVAMTVSSDAPEVVDVYTGSDDGGFELPAGGDALTPGTAVVTITLSDGTSHPVSVTVTE